MTEPTTSKPVETAATEKTAMPALPDTTDASATEQAEPVPSASKTSQRLSVFINKAKKTIEKVTSPDSEHPKEHKTELVSDPVPDSEPRAVTEAEEHQDKTEKGRPKLLFDGFFHRKSPAKSDKVAMADASETANATPAATETPSDQPPHKENAIVQLRRNATKLFTKKKEATTKDAAATDEVSPAEATTSSEDPKPDEKAEKKPESHGAQITRRLTNILRALPATGKRGKRKPSDGSSSSSSASSAAGGDTTAQAEAPVVAPKEEQSLHPAAATSAPIVQASA